MIKGTILNALILYQKFQGRRKKNSNWNSLVDQSLCKTEITKCDCTIEIYPFLREIISPTPSTVKVDALFDTKKTPDITTLVVVSLHCVLDLALRSIRAKNEDPKAFLFVEIVWNWLNFVKSMSVDIHFTEYFISFATSFSSFYERHLGCLGNFDGRSINTFITSIYIIDNSCSNSLHLENVSHDALRG